MKKTTQEFLHKQNKLRTKPGKRIAREEQPAKTKAKAAAQPKGKAASAGSEQERKQ